MRYHYEYAHVGTPMPTMYRIRREELVKMKVMTKGKKREAPVLPGLMMMGRAEGWRLRGNRGGSILRKGQR